MTLRFLRAALTLSLASLTGAAVADTTLLYNVNGWTATASPEKLDMLPTKLVFEPFTKYNLSDPTAPPLLALI